MGGLFVVPRNNRPQTSALPTGVSEADLNGVFACRREASPLSSWCCELTEHSCSCESPLRMPLDLGCYHPSFSLFVYAFLPMWVLLQLIQASSRIFVLVSFSLAGACCSSSSSLRLILSLLIPILGSIAPCALEIWKKGRSC
jgi:hypothetical protein